MLVEPERKQDVVPGNVVGGRDLVAAAHRGHEPAVRHAPVSPTNGTPWSSSARRLMRRTAVFCSATSRT